MKRVTDTFTDKLFHNVILAWSICGFKMSFSNVRISGTKRENLLGVSQNYYMEIVTHKCKADYNILLSIYVTIF